MKQSNKNIAFSALTGLKKSSVAKSSPSFFSKLFGLTKKTVYEFQDDLYKLHGSDINKKWMGGIIARDGKIFPNGKGYFSGKDGQKIKKEIKSFEFDNGDFYTGEWKDGKKKNGYGKYTFASRDSYEGEWKDGKKEGKGNYTWLNGNYYEGEWKDGKKEGKGKYTWLNGNYYEGEFEDDITTDFLEIIITDSKKKLHTITKGEQSYFYQLEGWEKQEIDMGNEKRLKSALLQFGNTKVNQQNGVMMKDFTELSKFIEEKKNTTNAKPSIHAIGIPGHAFTMLFEKGKVYCFDNGGLDSLKEWKATLTENNVEYLVLPHDPKLTFQLKDKSSIDIPIETNTLQYCCRHKANVVYEKLKELKGELKEKENLYDKFDEYLKEV